MHIDRIQDGELEILGKHEPKEKSVRMAKKKKKKKAQELWSQEQPKWEGGQWY